MIPEALGETLREITVAIIPVILAITLHEAAHGFAALMFGDDTAKRAGRISANPLHHIDPFGTIVLPIMLMLLSQGTMMFGWAKPVPVNFARLTPQRPGIILVALAGPMTNILLAVVSALLFYVVPAIPDFFRDWVANNLRWSFQFNLILAVFNLWPIPPLDGGKVLLGLLPRTLQMPLLRVERYAIFGLLLLMILPVVGQYVFGYAVGIPADWLGGRIQTLVGLG